MELQQSFDTELFIDEVEKRRAIWDFESEDYKNRVLKRSAWVELVDLFFEKDATVEQKKIYGKWFLVNPGEVDIILQLQDSASLQKRWKNLRDSFARELRKKKTTKSGSAAVKSTPYIYFQRLMFLENTMRNKETQSSIEEDETTVLQDVDERSDNEDLTMPQRPLSSGIKRPKMNPVDKHFSDIFGESQTLPESDDEDKLFCLSLYKELKRVPQHVRIRTKIQLLEVIQRAQDIHTQPQAYAPTPHNPPYNRNPYSQGPSTTGYALQRTAHNFMNPHVPVSHNFNEPHPTQATSPTDSVMSQESLMELYE
ncbi:uncharacterized protein LOC124370416 [Homalodisca vitripennis]|uniref:uncharacterized protein LOC124370416 n=1 Tax=Homalodisca vitripennis TaxID=197043 RepID=UPI001EEC5EC2|nr:uncharacterized protein LOC124370416 [Homalodisca vitripennis]